MNPVGEIVLAVDPRTWHADFEGFEDLAGNYTNGGDYNQVYVYWTEDTGSGLTVNLYVFFVGADTGGLSGQLFLVNSNNLAYTTTDTTYAANTFNMVIGWINGCGNAAQGTFIYGAQATVNPYGTTLDAGCLSGTYAQEWESAALFDPDDVGSSPAWEGPHSFQGWTQRHCIGDQVDWPTPALAFDPVDHSVAMAVSIYCNANLCPGTANGQNRIDTLQTYPFTCPDGGSGGFGNQGGGLTPSPCVQLNGTGPCVCDTSGCGSTPPSGGTDQILPQLAYNDLDNGTGNQISLIFYDNTGGGGGSGFGDILGQASADAGTSTHLVSSLQSDFGVIQFRRSCKSKTRVHQRPSG
jgi:hypothetical protein